MKHSFIIVLFFILADFQGFCQTVPDGQIKVYDSYQPKNGKSFGEKNKISINPLGVMIGDYPLYYERMFGNTFSVELAAGVTYENYIWTAVDFYGGTSSNYSNSDLTRSYKLGSTYSISPKVYLQDDCFEGSYLALCYRSRVYKDEVTEYQGTTFADPMKESFKLNSFTFNYGYMFHLGKGFMLDYYIGLGIRAVTESEFTSMYVTSNSYPYSGYTYGIQEKKSTAPTGMMGLKIGYAF
jgi:hypothetical protein